MLDERSWRLPRRWSNQVLSKIGPVFSGEVINVSGWRDADKGGERYRSYFPNASHYYVSNFHGERGTTDDGGTTDFELDLEQALPPALVGRFDVVFNHTVLEHVFDIFTAFANLCAMSRDAVIVVVPFAQRLHHGASVGDYWRVSAQALARLFDRNAMKLVFEAANHHRNAGNYVVGVGVRDPARWQGRLPAHAPIAELAHWIGQTRLRELVRGASRVWRALGV